MLNSTHPLCKYLPCDLQHISCAKFRPAEAAGFGTEAGGHAPWTAAPLHLQTPLPDSRTSFALLASCTSPPGRAPVCSSLWIHEPWQPVYRHHARIVRRHGAAVVVMAFDEQGQAASYSEKVRIFTV